MDKITNAEMLNPKNIVLTALFSILWAIVKYLPSPWFNSTRYVILKMFCKKIHSRYIGENVTVWFPWNIEIGKNVSINNGCTLDGTGGIIVEDSARIATNVGILTADHGYEDKDILIRKQGFRIAPIIIGEDAWIGASTNITKGVVVGKGAVIGCSSVVTKNVPDYSVIAGNPSKIIKYRV